MGVFEQFAGFFFFTGTDGIGAEFVDRLRSQSQMSHDRDAGAQDALYGFFDFRSAFHLDAVGMCLFHYADG